MRKLLIAAILFFKSLTFLSYPASGQLFIERYGVEQIDFTYFHTAGFSNLHVPHSFPLRQTFVNDYLNNLSIDADNSYGHYLKNLYHILYGMTPDNTIKTRTRILVERLGLKEISKNYFGYHANLYTIYDKDLILGLNPVFRYDFFKDEKFLHESTSLRSHGIESWLTWKNKLGAYIRFFDTVQSRGGRQHRFEPYVRTEIRDIQSVSYDQTIAYLGYTENYFSVRLGRGRHQFGPGIYHNLLLSANHPSYDYGELRFHYRNKIFFTYIHATLDPSPLEHTVLYNSKEGKPRKVIHRKYMAAHRIELLPSNRLSIGLSEAVIYGDRKYELAYLVPVNIFWSIGHDYKYDDNILWSFDTELRIFKGLSAYGELLLDEIRISKIASDNWHNQTGYLGGVRWIHPFGYWRHELRTEYVRLRPFVYGHWFDVNIYSHFEHPLGSVLPPNSDELRASWIFHIRPDITLDFFTILQRHGSTPKGKNPVGESIDEMVPDSQAKDNFHYPFLDGDREDLRETGLEGCFRVLERMEIKAVLGTGKYIDKHYQRFSLGLFWNY